MVFTKATGLFILTLSLFCYSRAESIRLNCVGLFSESAYSGGSVHPNIRNDWESDKIQLFGVENVSLFDSVKNFFNKTPKVKTTKIRVLRREDLLEQLWELQVEDGEYEMAEKILTTAMNFSLVEKWSNEINEEVLRQMRKDGLSLAQVSLYENRENYIDQVLARRGQKRGFEVDTTTQKPFEHSGDDQESFLKRLEKGQLFVDVGAKDAKSTDEEHLHSVRGHLLQFVFLAEHVEGFVDWVKRAGIPNTYEAYVFATLLDNPEAVLSPLFPGRWVEVFGEQLRIRN